MSEDDVASQTHTPPDTASKAPPTPPPSHDKEKTQYSRVKAEAQVAIQLLRRCRQGYAKKLLEPYWITRPLSIIGYDELQTSTEKDPSLRGYIKDKLRVDYDCRLARLTIRMPTPLHDLLIAGIIAEINSQLDRLRDHPGPAAACAKKILWTHTADVQLCLDDSGVDERSKRSPDSSWRFESARFPSVIVEVAYSQQSKDLSRLAEDYILGSDGNIEVVIGLDIDYRITKRCRVFVWRPRFEEVDGVASLAVRQDEVANLHDEIEHAVDGPTDLILALSDFVGSSSSSFPLTTFLNVPIIIPSHRLLSIFNTASRGAEQMTSGTTKPLPRGTKKRRRSSTPPEELESDDEKRFREDEEQTAKKVARGDVVFRVRGRRESAGMVDGGVDGLPQRRQTRSSNRVVSS